MSIPFSGQGTLKGLANPTKHTRNGRSRVRKRPFLVYLATTVSIIVILLSLAICRALLTRDRLSGATYRRLAGGGGGIDEQERYIIEGCLDLESDMGLLEQRATSRSTTDASHRLTELVSMLSEAAAAKESVKERRRRGGEAHSREQLLGDQSGSEHEGGGQVGLHTSSMQAFEGRGEFTGRVAAPLDPDSWIEAIPSIQSQPEDEERREGFLFTNDEGEPELAVASPSSKAAHTGILKNMLVAAKIRTHPYVRLPVLERGVTPRYVRASSLFEKRIRRYSPHAYLCTMRKLFAKQALNQKDVHALVKAVEELVNLAWLRSHRGPRGPSPIHIVESLGSYFMVFDSLVCAAEILGEHMQLHLWWEKFAANFDVNPLLPAPGPTRKEVAKFHKYLVKRLVAALEIYKRGERPPLPEVIALKTLLFCSPQGRHQFKNPKWDPWRDDGDCP
ncbi:hypothetical protein EMWEY_00022220 [Eimeria maxima]|uniref:Transmembrane protein n=1 Tax=Eimeria maxima TaxID=5804 RepID=U6M5E3_EIMMA|nr:hypothetical protein EMWEY_00022220 [Eimeria maxima]CDJ59452.1 hypothetical protein EMWEY_00022220 [Eimeria maxima]